MPAKLLQQLMCGEVRLGTRAEVGALRSEIAQLVERGVPRKIIWKQLTASGQVRSSYQAFTRRLRLMRIGAPPGSALIATTAATTVATTTATIRPPVEPGARPETARRLNAPRTFRPNPTPDLDALI